MLKTKLQTLTPQDPKCQILSHIIIEMSYFHRFINRFNSVYFTCKVALKVYTAIHIFIYKFHFIIVVFFLLHLYYTIYIANVLAIHHLSYKYVVGIYFVTG